MDKLEVELFQYGTLVFGKVLHTPEKLKNNGGPEKVLYKLDGYRVSTCRYPDLTGLCLYVHGASKTGDNRIIYCNYLTEIAAAKSVAMFEVIIDKINKSLKEGEACSE